MKTTVTQGSVSATLTGTFSAVNRSICDTPINAAFLAATKLQAVAMLLSDHNETVSAMQDNFRQALFDIVEDLAQETRLLCELAGGEQ